MMLIKKRALTVVLALILSASLSNCAIVETGNVGVKTSFGTAKQEPLQPGIHIALPTVDWITNYSTRSVALPESFTSLTQDGQKIVVTATATYALNGDKATEVFSKVGKNDEEVRNKIIVPALLAGVKDVISKYSMTEIIDSQPQISDEIKTAVTKRLAGSNYINFERLDITGFVLDEQVQEAIERKQIAQQDLARKQTEVETAKKEAERLKALEPALTDRNLMNSAIQKWDGSGIPPTVSGANFLISPDSKK